MVDVELKSTSGVAMEQEDDREWEEQEEDEDEEVGLQGRQSRHRNSTAVIISSSSSSGNVNGSHDNDSGSSPSPSIHPAEEFNNNNAAGDEFDTHQDQATEFTHGVECSIVETNFGDDELDAKAKKFDIQGLTTERNHQFGKNVEDESFSGLNNSSFKRFDNKTTVDADVDLIEEIDQEITELDLEMVLQKQDTHDLYCPNCNSCITRRVILHRRKRKIRNFRPKARHDNVETNVRSQFDANPKRAADDRDCDTANICSNSSPTLAADEHNHDRQTDIFRCLSCFSLFIPTGNGFKVFWLFGDSNENENMQNPEKISGAKKNWFFSIFASDKRKTATEQEGTQIKPQQSGVESLSPSTVQSLLLEKSLIEADRKSSMEVWNETLADQNDLSSSIQGASSPAESFCSVGLVNKAAAESQEAGKDILNSSKQEHILIENVLSNMAGKSDDAVVKNTGDAAQGHSEVDKINQYSDNMPPCHISDHPIAPLADRTLINIKDSAEGAQIKAQQSEIESLSPSTVQSLLIEKSLIAAYHQTNMEVGNETLADQNGLSSSIQGASSPAESFSGVRLINNAATESQEAEKDILNSSKQEHIIVENVLSIMAGKSDDAMVKNNTGDDVIVIVEREPTSSQGAQNIVVSAEAGILPQSGTQIDEHRRAEVSEAYGLDILKSIVYGGLIESVTSLGVVSSAAGADASTLNILALGLANLIGGLFIIGHNLRELKNDHSGGASSQLNEQEDQYQELLGRREKFLLHATVAVLSFIFFGLVPPVVYGFSFRRSDDKELKIAAVLVASLVCIILLAIGKGHIQKPPKAYVKTVLYYVITGLMGSGVSYIFGILIKKLLDKLGWFEYSLATTVPFLETNSMDRAWASSY